MPFSTNLTNRQDLNALQLSEKRTQEITEKSTPKIDKIKQSIRIFQDLLR